MPSPSLLPEEQNETKHVIRAQQRGCNPPPGHMHQMFMVLGKIDKENPSAPHRERAGFVTTLRGAP